MAALIDTTAAAESMVVIPVPAFDPPVNVVCTLNKTGDLAFMVVLACTGNSFIAQFVLQSFLFPISRTLLEKDVPGVCGALRNGRHVLGEIGIYEGRILTLGIGEQVISVPLSKEDIADLVFLMEEF